MPYSLRIVKHNPLSAIMTTGSEFRDRNYLGVGPDQNYSYIAHVKPQIAFIIDIRRQNALQHLFFKALFQLSSSRIQYLGAAFWQTHRHIHSHGAER